MYDYKDQIKIMQLLACNIYAYRKQDIIVAESNLIALGENSMLRTSSVDVNLRATVTIKDLKYKGVDLIKNKDNILSACGITPERCGILNSRNGATKTFEQYQLLVQGVTTEENVFKTKIQHSLQDTKAEVNELKVALENNSVVYSDISSTSDVLLQYVKEFAENLEFKNDCFYCNILLHFANFDFAVIISNHINNLFQLFWRKTRNLIFKHLNCKLLNSQK